MSLALTIFIVLVVAVLAVIGSFRDTRRGLLALLGTLFGAILVEFWGPRLGVWLAGALGGEQQRMGFIANSLMFLWGALVVGYGGSLLLGRARERATLPQRLASAALGLLNGVLIVGFLLRYATGQLPDFAAMVRATPAAAIVHDGLPPLFLGLASAATLLALVRGVVGMFSKRPAPAQPAPSAQPAQPPVAGAPAAGAERRVDDRNVLNKINRQM
jgi:hypothetical protein